VKGDRSLAGERAIHFAMFILLLVGLCGISLWACYKYIEEGEILKMASTAFIWGVILTSLYLGFKKLGWRWWS